MKCAWVSRLKMSLQAHNVTLFNASREEAAATAEEEEEADVLGAGNKVTYVGFYLHRPSTAAVFVVSYLLIFLVCLAGNGAVCFVVLRGRRMRSVTNVFILNLAVSDLLVGIFCMPTTLLDNIITGWPFGSLACKLSGTVQGISVSASVFTLVAIAVDRFRCIVYPFKQKLSISAAAAIIVTIWVLAVAIMCPSGAMLQVTREQSIRVVLGSDNRTAPFYWCRENWPNREMRRIYTTVLFANIYLAPLSLIVVMYARIGVTLFRTSAPGGGGVSKKKRRVIKMLLVVALLFVLSWLPLWTLMMLSDYAGLTPRQQRVVNIYAYPLAHWLAFFNSSVNPVIYGFFNENFRAAFRSGPRAADARRGRRYSRRPRPDSTPPADEDPVSPDGPDPSGCGRVRRLAERDLVLEDLEEKGSRSSGGGTAVSI
ncbi:neuropeptide FF receptor 2a [Hippocampus zosterae]|uniref:neuropeptide FF receptor 2a n=1 Tax=Hippocampus zosterae TaxID=109293 RepID=UPI00223CEBBB|nr:neuropeptide FF receptor 2a [Hippocampus zosterae]